MEIKELAKLAISYFETKQRDDGINYWTTKENRPEWLQTLIRVAHFDMLPDDYKYSYILDSLYIITEDSEEDEYALLIDVDVYTSDLTGWLASHIGRVEYVDRALEDNIPEPASIVDLLQTAQYLEREEVFYSVLDSLKNVAEQLDCGFNVV